MTANRLVLGTAAAAAMLAWWTPRTAADTDKVGSKHIKHVLLLSIDGMHAVDFHNCARGIAGANGGEPYCPNMAGLSRTGINYVGAASSSPQTLSPASPRAAGPDGRHGGPATRGLAEILQRNNACVSFAD